MSLLGLLFSEYPSVFYYFYSRLYHSGVKVTYNFYHFFFCTFDDSCLYQIAILQASISFYHKRS